jgi:hypothetical protein
MAAAAEATVGIRLLTAGIRATEIAIIEIETETEIETGENNKRKNVIYCLFESRQKASTTRTERQRSTFTVPT